MVHFIFLLNCLLNRKIAGKLIQKTGCLQKTYIRKMSVSAEVSNRNDGPLAGVRIIDLSRVLAGPFCTMLLGDLGAEVIKVEIPGRGDDSRAWGPPYFPNGESFYFTAVNRNKKSIAVNIKTDRGRNIIERLVQKSDVLVENYVPGKLDSLGLGYENLKQLSPNIIYCSITGFGQTGPSSQIPGYDLIAAGYGGLLDITGPEDGEPCRVGVSMTDIATGLYAHGAILASILERRRTGKGQKIDCNLLDTQVSCLSNIASCFLNSGVPQKRRGTAHNSIVPYQAYPTADGYIIIGVGNEGQFQSLSMYMELDDIANDSRFKTNALRVANRTALNDILKKRFMEKTTNAWLTKFEGAKFPRGPINNLEQVFKDPQVIHNKMVVEVQHPETGKIKFTGPAVQFGNGGNYCRSPPPTLGEHTAEVLENILEMNNVEIQQFKSEGVCQ